MLPDERPASHVAADGVADVQAPPLTPPPPAVDARLAETRLPAWPGPVATVAGFAISASALTTAAMAGLVRPEVQPFLYGMAAVGGILLFGGLVYALLRQLRRRRVLPMHRYRGPSVVLMLVLVVCLATAATLPFTEDAAALVLGEGTPSPLGAIVLLTSTQAALLLVSWLFVLAPRALAGALERGSHLRALLAGVGWGALAWLGASAATVAILLLMERLGIPPEMPVAEQAVKALDPFVVVVAIVILAPIAEEVFFRGIAFNAWFRERGLRFAYIGSAALFAAIHASLVSLLPIFGLGLALAWIYRRTRSLVGPIAMHATVNGISVTIALLVRYEVIRLPG